MVNINLLPWRAKQARYEKQILLYLLGGAIICALVIVMGCDQYLSSRQQATSKNLEKLKKELVWREGLANHINQQPALPHENPLLFFQRLNEVNAQEVCFNQIKKTKSGIELIGIANSSDQLSTFLQQSSFAKHFAELKVNQLQQQQSGQLKFHLLGK